jgi:predicted Zn-dependent peptidase
MNYNIKKFNNNLRLIHQKPKTNNNYSVINMIIGFGSIHEPDNLKGSAHYIEHMCFKGNSKIKNSKKLSTILDKYGAYTNAYTDKKYTNYIIVCPDKYLLECIDIITHMVLFSKFDKNEFKKEYNVVLEENHRDKQDFYEQMNTSIDEHIYNGSSYEKPIDCIEFHKKKLECDDLYKLYKKYYTTDKTILSICSTLSFDKIINYCKSHTISNYKSPNCESYNLKLNIPYYDKYKIIIKKEKLTDVTYLSITYKTCGYFSKDTYILNFIKNLLSSGMSSKLFFKLREEKGLTYTSNAETNYYEHSGDFSISCETNFNKLFGKNNTLDTCIEVINDILNFKITNDEIEKIKGYLYGQDILSLNDNKYICEYNAVNLCINNLNNNVLNEYDKNIKNINKNDIITIIKKYFNKNNLTLCIVSNKTIYEKNIVPYINKLVY